MTSIEGYSKLIDYYYKYHDELQSPITRDKINIFDLKY